MKHHLIDLERFRLGGYSKLFQDVVSALVANGTILSEEATTEALKAIYEEGIIASSNGKDQIKHWNELKKEL